MKVVHFADHSQMDPSDADSWKDARIGRFQMARVPVQGEEVNTDQWGGLVRHVQWYMEGTMLWPVCEVDIAWEKT